MKPVAAPNPDARRKSAPRPAEKPESPHHSRQNSSSEMPLFLRKSHQPGPAQAESQPLPNRIRAAASQGGQTLAPYLQHAFNRQFGMDASRVRIHTGGEADRLNRDLRARAFTTGRDIFFRAGEYRPNQPGGLELLAHEVVHTEQQRQGAVSTQAASDSAAISEPGDQFEQEADNAARSFVAGQTTGAVTPTKASHPVQRKCAACAGGGAACPKCEEEEKLKVQRKAEPASANSAAPSHEMIPGYQARYSAARQTGGAMIIQRDNIDHRDVDWSDFKGKAPKGGKFDAETFSGFVDPQLKSAIPTTLTAVDTGEPCKLAGKDATKFKVNIAIDPAKINVKSFMSQEKSWHKAYTTDDEARKQMCLSETSPKCEKAFDAQFALVKKQRAKEVAACQKDWDTTARDADKQCHEQERECKDAFKVGNTSFGSATSAKGCAQVFKDCKDEAMAAHSYDAGGASASKRAECSTSFGDDLEKQLKDTVTWTSSDGGATVSNRADCRKAPLLDWCVKDAMQTRSDKLLTHEQNHFHLTAAMAAKAEQDLRAMAAGFPKEVTACGQKGAMALAKKTLAAESQKLNTSLAAAKREMDAMQKKYDAESKHGAVDEKQTEWQERIAKGFTKPNP